MVLTITLFKLSEVCIPPDFTWRIGAAVRLKHKTLLIPDLVFGPSVKGGTEFQFGCTSDPPNIPRLVLEATSNDRKNDFFVKKHEYAASGKKDYWIVDRKEQEVKLFIL